MKGVEFENFWRWWEMMGGDERLEAFGGVNGGRAGGLGVKEYRELGRWEDQVIGVVFSSPWAVI